VPDDDTVSHSARIWNYWLGGTDNRPVDREVGERFRDRFADIVPIARSSREFQARAVTYLAAECGIRQFLDLGSGLPAVRTTHEAAHRVAASARVLYVDNDPVVLAHPLDAPNAELAAGDLLDPGAVLERAARTLDLLAPVGLLLLNVLGHVPSADEARELVERYLRAFVPGSALVVADGSNVLDGPAFEEAIAVWNASGSLPYHLRRPEEIASYFDGLDLVEPGIVSCRRWRPRTTDPAALRPVDEFGGVGRKRS
jgi:hypothetical protein